MGDRAHYEKNRERILAEKRARYRANPEPFKAKSKATYYKLKDFEPERLKAYSTVSNKNYYENHKESERARSRSRTPEKHKEYRLRHEFGLEPEDFESLFVAQAGECPICQHPLRFDKTLCVDHDHQTGKVRGLLHSRCNSAIGFLLDSPFICMSAAKYLVNHGKAL